MPNAVSCLFFACRNTACGKKEKNLFKEGIGFAQSVRAVNRTIDASASVASKVSAPVKTVCNVGSHIADKIVYPLIITSGVYNTIKSDDKVKTGVMQASGIGTMFAFEQVASKGLKKLDKKILETPFFKNNKAARIGWYIAKGLSFVTASLTGYNVGSSGGESIVDKARDKKATENKEISQNIDKSIEDTLNNVFSDIELK